jgi:hypothetical protein
MSTSMGDVAVSFTTGCERAAENRSTWPRQPVRQFQCFSSSFRVSPVFLFVCPTWFGHAQGLLRCAVQAECQAERMMRPE